ncbi:hypothetical protein A5764_09515 [Mycobacterium sp. 852002-51057_SCH5723018]|nr:hypothetical protein A5764_09515 [Mycobacterium sp. 852002-51057_SCH5723018]
MPAALQELRDLRVLAVGAETAAKMDCATAELAEVNALANMPGIGDTAPSFELPDQNGTIVSLDGLLATGPAVVVFYRGVWCPFCSLTLRSYQQHLPELRQMGGSLAAISLQTPDDSLTTAERNALTYHVLSDDAEATVSRAYGLLFEVPGYLRESYRQLGHPLPAFNRSGDWRLPVPATFVIDQDRTVRFAGALPDYTYRPDPAEVMAVVRKVTA